MKTIIYIFLVMTAFTAYAQDSGLPLLDMNKTRFDFGKTAYMATKTDKLVLKNIGDTVLAIYQIDSLKPPFYAKFFFPDTLQKNDSVKFNISYRPFRAAKDSQRVFLRADTRLSHSIGMLFDVSLSMDENMPSESIRKITAAVNAGKSFIAEMLATPKIWDEAGIFSFARTFTVNQDFTNNKTLLNNSLPSQLRNYTAFYDACIEVLNRLAARKFQKVMIALTDGEDNSSQNANAASVIASAKAKNIKIYTIGIGSSVSDATLRNIANSTGGEFFKANTGKELNDIYYRIFKMLSKNIQLYFDVLGYCSGPEVSFACTGDTLVKPGDTLAYKIYLHGVSATGAMDENYNLGLSFNSSTIIPIEDKSQNYSYFYQGKLIIHNKNKVNIDSFPLTEVKFMTLLGDSGCTDLKIDVLSWENNIFEPVSSGSTCRICVNACARDLRLIQRLSATSLSQNFPNPFSGSSSIKLNIFEKDNYKIVVYDMFGRKIIYLLDEVLSPGELTLPIDSADLPAGTYIYSLQSSSGTLTRMMVVLGK